MADLAQLGIIIDPSDATRGADQVNRALDSMSARARRSMNDIQTMTGKLKDALFGIQGLIATIGIGVGFGALIEQSKTFESSLSELSAITGVTGDKLDSLAETAKDLGAAGTASAEDIVTAFKLVASANSSLLDTEGALEAVTNEVLTLADAAGLELEPATTALVGTLNQFQLGADQANRVINVLAAASKVGSAEIEDLAATFGAAGTSAAQARVSVEELAAAAEVLGLAEIKGAEAGTALRNIILKLNTSIETNFRPSVVGLVGALENLNEAGLTDIEMLKRFGLENINAVNAILSNIDTLEEWTKEVTGTTVAQEQAAIRTANFESAMKELNNAVGSLIKDIGSDLLPSLTNLAKELASGVRWIRENTDELKRWGDLIVIVGKFLAAYILIFKGLPIAIAATSTALIGLSTLWARFQLTLGAGVGTLIAAKNALFGVGAGATAAGTGIRLLSAAFKALLIIPLAIELGRWLLGFQKVQEILIKQKAGFRALGEVLRTTTVQVKAFGGAILDLENPFKAAEEAGAGLQWRLSRIGLEAQGELNQLRLDFQKTKKDLESGIGTGAGGAAPGLPPPEVTAPPPVVDTSNIQVLEQTLSKLLPLRAATLEYVNTFKLLNDARDQGKITAAEYQQAEEALVQTFRDQVGALQASTEEARERQAWMERGKQLTLEMRTEQEILNDRLFEYSDLLQEGAISYETYERAVARANEEIRKTPETLSENEQLLQNFKENLAGGLADAAVGARDLGTAMRSLVQDIARVIARMLILKAIEAGISAFGGGGGAAAGTAVAATAMQSGSNRVANTGMALLHKDEMVVPARSAEAFRERPGSKEDGGIGATQQRQQFNIVNFVDRQAFADWMESNEGQDTLVNSINMNRQSLGI